MPSGWRWLQSNDRNRRAGLLRTIVGLPYRWFTGNGYRPSRALWWAIGLVAVRTLAYGSWADRQDFTATSTTAGPTLQPMMYSADTLLPVIDFGEADRFDLSSTAPNWLRWFRWGQIGAGWAIAGALGATAARIARDPGT